MKRTLLILSLFASYMADAQLTQANEPAIGASSSMYLCDSFATNYAGVTGTGVTWDYSNLVGYFGETRTVEVVDASTTSNAATFPGATKAFKLGTNITTYFDSDVNSRFSQGFMFTEPSVGDVFVTFENDALTQVQYPFAYGDSYTDPFDGSLDFTFNMIPINESVTGNAYLSVDGSGTLQFPGAVSVTNVIRYKSVDTSYTNIPFVGAVDVVREQYEYYDHASQELPIFINSTITMLQNGSPLSIVGLVLSKYPTDDYMNVGELDALNTSIYPNPANDVITVNSEVEGANLTITDQQGRVIHSEAFNQTKTISIESFDTGIYFVTIEKEGALSTQKFVKQ
jgi:hypothetical protein